MEWGLDTFVVRKDLEQAVYLKWQARPGDQQIEAELRQLLSQHARAVLFSILRREDLSLVDEAVNRVMVNLANFRGEGLFTTWAHRILMSVMYDQRRLERSRKEVSLEGLNFAFSGAATIPTTDILLTVKKLLTPTEYTLFEYTIVMGYSQREIGELLKVPERTINRRWTNLVRKLKDAFVK
jgi:RNA polymerase sigma factor (sigma-70 family)